MNVRLDVLGVDYLCTRRKFLGFNLVARNLKVKYRNSWAGMVWTLVIPGATAAVYYIVFKFVMRVQMEHYIAFLMAGLLPWTFYSSTILNGMESIVGNRTLINKVPVPPQIFPLTESITGLINLVIGLPFVIGLAIYLQVPLSTSLLTLPPLILALFLQSYAMAIITGICFVYLRDLRHVIGIVMQTWFYATPILYRSDMLPQGYEWVLSANPLGHLMMGFHAAFNLDAPLQRVQIGIIVGWTLLLCLVSIVLLRTVRSRMVEDL